MVFKAATFVFSNCGGGFLFHGEGGGKARVRVFHHVDERTNDTHGKAEEYAHYHFDC